MRERGRERGRERERGGGGGSRCQFMSLYAEREKIFLELVWNATLWIKLEDLSHSFSRCIPGARLIRQIFCHQCSGATQALWTPQLSGNSQANDEGL